MNSSESLEDLALETFEVCLFVYLLFMLFLSLPLNLSRHCSLILMPKLVYPLIIGLEGTLSCFFPRYMIPSLVQVGTQQK